MMKKNKMMRLASFLLVAVLLSTCAISGTFAKYVTSADASDAARVAKWGVTVTADAEGTFAKEYASDTADYAAATVISSEKVVAPGTSGVLANVAVTGTPEVAVRVSYTATLDLGDNWVDANGAYYCPLEITVNGTTYKGTDSQYTDVNAFETAVNNAINGFTQDFAANKAINYNADTSITWKWAFEGNDDVKDTALGDAAAAGKAATIDLKMTVTATQID